MYAVHLQPKISILFFSFFFLAKVETLAAPVRAHTVRAP